MRGRYGRAVSACISTTPDEQSNENRTPFPVGRVQFCPISPRRSLFAQAVSALSLNHGSNDVMWLSRVNLTAHREKIPLKPPPLTLPPGLSPCKRPAVVRSRRAALSVLSASS